MVEARIGIVVQFPQSFLPEADSTQAQHMTDLLRIPSAMGHCPSLPLSQITRLTPPSRKTASSSITLSTSRGRSRPRASCVTSSRSLLRLWPLHNSGGFVPGTEAGTNTDSAVALVVTFRHP